MGLLYAIFMLAALLVALGSLFGMVGQRLPELVRAASGLPVQSAAARRLLRA